MQGNVCSCLDVTIFVPFLIKQGDRKSGHSSQDNAGQPRKALEEIRHLIAEIDILSYDQFTVHIVDIFN